MPPPPRPHRIVAVLGAPATGKTTLTRTLIREHPAPRARKRILDPGGELVDLGGEWPSDDDAEKWLEQRRRLRDAELIVLDDADQYAPPQPPPGTAWRRYYLAHRQQRVDIIVSAKRVQNLSRMLLGSVHTFYVFQVEEPRARESLGEFIAGRLPPEEWPQEPYRYARVPVLSREPVTFHRTRPK